VGNATLDVKPNLGFVVVGDKLGGACVSDFLSVDRKSCHFFLLCLSQKNIVQGEKFWKEIQKNKRHTRNKNISAYLWSAVSLAVAALL
jgi:hypothetical protein